MRFNIQFKMLLGFVLVVLLVSMGSYWSIRILKQTWADQDTLADFREAEESLEVFAEAGLLQKLDVTRKKALVTDRIPAIPEGESVSSLPVEATDPESTGVYTYASGFDLEADEIEKQLRDLHSILARLNRSEGMAVVRARHGSRGLPAVLRGIEADFAEYRRLFHRELKTPVAEVDVGSPQKGWHLLVDAMDRRIARDLVMPVAEARMYVETAASNHQEVGQQLVAVMPLLPGIVAILISFLISRRIANPIRELRRATERIAGGDFTRPVRVQSRDEVGDLARALNLMSRRLAELDEMKSGFLFNVSHELKTPLTSIKEAAALLQEEVPGVVNEKQRRLLEIITAETRILIRMIIDLLDLARMEAGRMGYRFERTSPEAIVRRAVDELQFMAQRRGVTLTVHVAPNLGSFILDTGKLVDAVKNLVDNAVKFSPRGGEVVIGARLASPTAQPAQDGETIWSTAVADREDRVKAPLVQISVRDLGPGIPEKDLPMVFEKFYQSERRSDSKVKGTGLGLAIVRHVVEAHGGSVAVRSAPKKGSTFTITLPLAANAGESEAAHRRSVPQLEVKHDAV